MSDHEDSRPPLDPAAVDDGGGRWRVEVVTSTTSTNADVAARFRGGEPAGLVLVAEHQTAGRGRLGRPWVTPPRASLTVSFLLEPHVEPARWPWLPLLTGIATAEAVRRVADLDVVLKWPNDVLAGGQKLGGILLERVERGATSAAVLGIGLNVSQARAELPVPEATSLALVRDEPVDRAELLGVLLEELGRAVDAWEAGEDPRAAYLELCSTPGQEVRVAVPGGEVLGTATDVDGSGRLVVRTADGEERLGVGDVVHVRPAAQQ